MINKEGILSSDYLSLSIADGEFASEITSLNFHLVQ